MSNCTTSACLIGFVGFAISGAAACEEDNPFDRAWVLTVVVPVDCKAVSAYVRLDPAGPRELGNDEGRGELQMPVDVGQSGPRYV